MKHPEIFINKSNLKQLELLFGRPLTIFPMKNSPEEHSEFKKIATIRDDEIKIWINYTDLYKTIYSNVVVNQNINQAFIKNANKELKYFLREIVDQDFQNKNPDFMLIIEMVYSIAISMIISNFVQMNLVLYVGLAMVEVEQSIIETFANITIATFWFSLGAQAIENLYLYRKNNNPHKAKDFIDFLCNIFFVDISENYVDKMTAIILMDDLLVDGTHSGKK